jgi:hypothetical protein
MGRHSESSAQSKRGVAGIEHGDTELGEGSTRDGDRETAVVEGSAAGVVDVTLFSRSCRRSSSGTFVGSETLRFRGIWGELGG